MTIDWLIILVWFAWSLFHLFLVVAGALFIRPANTPVFNGFFIYCPPRVRVWLDDREFEAVMQHEREHRRRFHIWYNLIRVCCFLPVTKQELFEQELEADAAVTDPAALATAMKRLGAYSSNDLRRVALLEARAAAQGSQDASNPTPGMGDNKDGGFR